jgi:hypothetical protein
MSPAAYFEAANTVDLSGPSCRKGLPIQEMFRVANAIGNTQYDQALKQVQIALTDFRPYAASANPPYIAQRRLRGRHVGLELANVTRRRALILHPNE